MIYFEHFGTKTAAVKLKPAEKQCLTLVNVLPLTLVDPFHGNLNRATPVMPTYD